MNKLAVEKKGITILSILFIFGFIFKLFMIVGEYPVMLLGNVVSGDPARIVHIAGFAITGYLAYGFFRLLRSAWYVALIFFSFGVIDSTIGMSFSSLIINLIIVIYLKNKRDYFNN